MLGWLGLVAILKLTDPSGGTRWAVFFTLVIAVTGTMLPVTAYLNRRFSSQPPATANVVLRQALWVGVCSATLAWLQLGRVLNTPITILLLVGFALMEGLLRLRERSQWKP
jgi:hypothetical protein